MAKTKQNTMSYGKNIITAPTIKYNEPVGGAGVINRWWLAGKDYYQHIWPLVERMKQHQAFRTSQNLRHAQLYANMRIFGLKAGQTSRITDPKNHAKNRVTYNVVKSCIDSATSKIATKRPRPVYLTKNGSWLEQQKCKNLNDFILGMFMRAGTGQGEDRNLYGIGKQAFRDACIFGTGVSYLYSDGKSIKAERNICEEIYVDETEGMYRMPRQIHRHRNISREVLLDKYGSDPKKAKSISDLPGVLESDEGHYTTSDLVTVLESWHLPSGETATDGRHVVSIETCDLAVNEYTDDYFPFLIQRWSQRVLGFYGMGLSEELTGIQLEINKLLRLIQQSQNLMSSPQIWLEHASRIANKKFTNEPGSLNYYIGEPPVSIVPQAMSQEVYNHVERLYQRGYEITGISVMSATSTKPTGLDSAVAIREHKDTETERFADQVENYDAYYLDAAELIRKMCKKELENGNNIVIKVPDGNNFKTLRFSDVNISDDNLMAMPRPSNLLPTEPSGRLAKVQELTQAGYYTKDESLELLDFPDLEKTNSIKLSSRQVVIKTVEAMIEKNEFISPEPYMNLDFAREYAQNFYLKGKIEEMPEDRLELLRRFIGQSTEMINKAQEALMPPAPVDPALTGGMPAEGVSQAVPEAMPTSDLIPQAS